MEIKTPTTEQVAAICSEHAARYPEPAAITMVGDRGVAVRLPFILGSPSGACKLAADKKAPIWASFVGAALKMSEAPGNAEELAANDCILYPDFATYKEWCTRWPALPSAVWRAVRRKIGMELDAVEEISFDDELPDAVKAALVTFPAASIRRVNVRARKVDRQFVCLISPPPAPSWRFFLEAMRKPRADHWSLTMEMAQGSIKIAHEASTNREIDVGSELLTPWPGVALLTLATVSVLAGQTADVELGEF
jgi:hypothetical protein